MQFKINGEDYFLVFAEEERRWYLVAPSAAGVRRISVYVDAVKWERPGGLEKSAGTAGN